MLLKSKILKGVQWTTIAMLGTTILQIIKLATLARVLTPENFGLMAIVMVVIGFAQAFGDMGISSAIIQHQDITKNQLSSLYWLNIVSGFVLAIVVVATAPLVSSFYEYKDLELFIVVISLVFIVTAIGQQFRLLFQKDLDFKTIAIVNVLSQLIATLSAIAMALFGYGVWSLVVSVLLAAALNSLGFLITGLRRYDRPDVVFNYNDIRSFLGFGLYQMGERTVNYLSASVDKILIGKFVGMNAVGFYDMAWQLIIFPLQRINPIVNAVALPAYSKIQNEAEVRARYYSASVRLLSLITIPLLVFLLFFSEEVVMLVYGDGWDKTATLVSILAVVGVTKALGNPGGALILSMGRADVGFWWNVAWVTIVSFGITISLWLWSTVESAAYTLLILSLTVGLFWHGLVAKIGKINYWPIFIHFARILVICIIIGYFTRLFLTVANITSNTLSLLVSILFFASVYFVYITVNERAFISQILQRR